MKKFSILLIPLLLPGCVPPGELQRPELPSLSYTRGLHQQRFEQPSMQHGEGQHGAGSAIYRTMQANPELMAQGASGGQMGFGQAAYGQQGQYPQVQPAYNSGDQAQYRFVKDSPPEEQYRAQMGNVESFNGAARHENGSTYVSNMESPPVEFPPAGGDSYVQVTRNSNPNVRPYQGPLHIGEPGASASLWRAQGLGSRLFRDHRAFQPMDLITIVVSEKAQGTKEADTATTKESSFLAGISELFNFADSLEVANPGLDTATLLDANITQDFTGEGQTTRSGSLTTTIAAMVVEVLPNGVMRVEGEKVISVNNEEQVIVISGLVRPRDVNSKNEVMSSKIAHLRIDYFGKGMIGDVQFMGWFGRLVNKLWPF
ncbi:MAG: flagellar basal body L-ring protein FlgH [Bdellovibrionales bacterium]|nr:flagellar basal body L-ring protein FlgH [Bdellovibrionales bacterium]